MKEFRINKYLSLKLEMDGTIDIYVENQKFMTCKHIILGIPIKYPKKINNFESIDEFVRKYEVALNETKAEAKEIPAENAFWAHCSNMQVWYESNYDTRVLHSELAFPLLKKLSYAGDPVAQKVFKEEIAKRMESGYLPVILFLLSENYVYYFLNEEERTTLFSNIESSLGQILTLNLKKEIKMKKKTSYSLPIIRLIMQNNKMPNIKDILKNQILNILRKGKKEEFNHLISIDRIFDMFNFIEISQFLWSSSDFKRIMEDNNEIRKIIDKDAIKLDENERKELYEELLLKINYPLDQKEIAEIVKEELEFTLYNKKIKEK